MFDPNLTSPASETSDPEDDMVRVYPPCRFCDGPCVTPADCAAMLRAVADDEELHAEAARVPEVDDELTCMACGAEPTNTDGEWGYCAMHAPVDAEAAVF